MRLESLERRKDSSEKIRLVLKFHFMPITMMVLKRLVDAIHPFVKPENLFAMAKAAHRYGKYSRNKGGESGTFS